MEGASRGIVVQEVLTKDNNYQRWRSVIRNYLRGKNLWDVVKRGRDPPEVNAVDNRTRDERIRRDAEALYTIQLSCEQKIIDEIGDHVTAQEAWNYLALRYGSELNVTPDIEQGKVDDNLDDYKELYKWVEEGNSEAVKSFIRVWPEALFEKSDFDGRTVLHAAAMAGHVEVIKVLVRNGKKKILKEKDSKGCTALALVADLTGNTKVAKCLVENDNGEIRRYLFDIPNNDGNTPLLLAAQKAHKDMTRYLYQCHTTEQIRQYFCNLLKLCIQGKIFDVALRLLESHLNGLPTESLSHVLAAMLPLARMPYAFLSDCQYNFLQRIIYRSRFSQSYLREHKKYQSSEEGCDDPKYFSASSGSFCPRVMNFLLLSLKFLGGLFGYVFITFLISIPIFGIRKRIRKIYKQKCTHEIVKQILEKMKSIVEKLNNSQLQEALAYEAMLDASKHGIIEFIEAMIAANQDLLWAKDSCGRNVFSYAILRRRHKVFGLIHTLNGRKDIIKNGRDVFGNNLLHLAGHLAPASDLNRRPGAALQMQRELQWFKAVERVVRPKCKQDKNDDDKKPRKLFTENHKELVKEGERWAKQAAKSFALVGILITTVMFAAAFTVPGGNDQQTGVPIFINNRVLTTFVVADAISLSTSCTSVLIFIWILTSRFHEKDFLIILPLKLLSALIFLFFSVASMMIAFFAALGIVLKNCWTNKPIVVGGIALGSIPVIMLIPSQLILIYEIFRSTVLANPLRRNK
ncbi:hypothetical protein Fmac_002884 [Flemingia macrophylla]|uniref:PGG domain-containing protein n=1 Tax=Flemingia macrophylla TaxID=520843 RepID=A0ABD1NL68_9FABA